MDQSSSDGFAEDRDDDDVTADGSAATAASCHGIPDSIPAKKLKDGSITFEVTIRHLIEQTLLHALKRPEFRKTKLVVTSGEESDSADDDPVMSSSPFVAVENGSEGRSHSLSNYSTSSRNAPAAAGTDAGAEALCTDPFSPSSTVPDCDSVEGADLPSSVAAAEPHQNNVGAGGASSVPIKLRMKRTYSNSIMQPRGSLDEQAGSLPPSRPGSAATLTASEGASPCHPQVELSRSVDAVGTKDVYRDVARSSTAPSAHGSFTMQRSRDANGNVGASTSDEYVALDLSMRSVPAPASTQGPQILRADAPCLATALPSWNRAPVRPCDIVHYSETESALEQLATVAAAAAAAAVTTSTSSTTSSSSEALGSSSSEALGSSSSEALGSSSSEALGSSSSEALGSSSSDALGSSSRPSTPAAAAAPRRDEQQQ